MSLGRLAIATLCATALALACGKSKQERAFDNIGSICNGLVGATLAQAAQQTGIDNAIASGVGAASSSPVCPNPPTLFPSIGGTCAEPTPANPQCEVFFEWVSTDPGLCSAQAGCCFICEMRVMQGSITTTDNGASTPICASRWLPRQFCQ